MARLLALVRRLRSDERGMTLIELLVVPTAALTVLGASFGLMRAATDNDSRAQTRAAATHEVRSMMDDVVREVREGWGIIDSDPEKLTLLTFVHRSSCGGPPAETAIQCQVTYECSSGACTRTEGPPGGGGSAVVAVSGLSSDQVFNYSPNASDPSWVGMQISVPRPEGGEAVTLSDGAALRNEALGQ